MLTLPYPHKNPGAVIQRIKVLLAAGPMMHEELKLALPEFTGRQISNALNCGISKCNGIVRLNGGGKKTYRYALMGSQKQKVSANKPYFKPFTPLVARTKFTARDWLVAR